MIPGVAAEGLTYTYPSGKGIAGVTFIANPGETCCVYGKNGAGKSTLLNVLSTIFRPTGGRFTILGSDGVRDRGSARARLFPVFDENSHFETVNGWDNLDFFNTIYTLARMDDSDRV